MRFELKIGKFGFYFFDTEFNRELTLLEVLGYLNTFNENILAELSVDMEIATSKYNDLIDYFFANINELSVIREKEKIIGLIGKLKDNFKLLYLDSNSLIFQLKKRK